MLLRCCSPLLLPLLLLLLLLLLPLARGEGGRDEGGLPRGCLMSAMDQARVSVLVGSNAGWMPPIDPYVQRALRFPLACI